MRNAVVMSVGLVCALAAAPVRAEIVSFEFSQFFSTGSAGSLTISGTFSGNFQNGRISDITDARLFRDGNAFRGNGALYTFQFDKKTRRWGQGGYLSLDGSDNNIMFIDTDYGAGDASFFNYFYSVTGIGNAAFQPSFYRYRVPLTTALSVRPVPNAVVPEPSSWALLIIGFGAVGAASRRRRGTPARLAFA